MNTFMAALYFKGTSSSDAINNAELAFEACNASLSKGMAMFGSFAYSATLMASLDGAWNGSSAPDLSTGNIDGVGNNGTDEELGTAVLNIQSVYCSQGSSDQEICAQIEDILAGSTDPTTIGSQFRDYVSQ
jgi:hypothetical protein